MEQAAERTEALEPHFETDVGHAELCAAQQLFCLFNASFDQVLVRRFSEGLPEQAQKVITREARFTGNLVEVERTVITDVDKVPGPAEALINVRRWGDVFPSHDSGLSRW